jgi:hypothetical protein
VVDEIHRTRELSKQIPEVTFIILFNSTNDVKEIIVTRLKHNLQRAPLNRLIDTDTATKEIPSIDKITKGLLWQ